MTRPNTEQLKLSVNTVRVSGVTGEPFLVQ